ncbi:MAG: hypothetical protein WBD02_08050 [Acidimicrobiia bacterium]
MKGRWAQGLEPRNFLWVIQGRLAASERPGGYSRSHRKVRRAEELVWLHQQGFTRVISLLESPHNLQAYRDANIAYVQVPLLHKDDLTSSLKAIYDCIGAYLADPREKLLMHHEEFGERLVGVLGGLLLYLGMVDAPTHAIQLIERLTKRELGAEGREIIATTVREGLKKA